MRPSKRNGSNSSRHSSRSSLSWQLQRVWRFGYTCGVDTYYPHVREPWEHCQILSPTTSMLISLPWIFISPCWYTTAYVVIGC